MRSPILLAAALVLASPLAYAGNDRATVAAPLTRLVAPAQPQGTAAAGKPRSAFGEAMKQLTQSIRQPARQDAAPSASADTAAVGQQSVASTDAN